MQYKEKTVLLKNGQNCLIKSPTAEDAEALVEHIRQTSGETDFMARYEEEVTMTVETERKWLTNQLDDPKAIMLSAFVDGKMAASAGLHAAAPFEKYQHRAEFGISIKKAFWGMGIGSAVLREIVQAARTMEYTQIELDVSVENARAVALYEKMGFKIIGTNPKFFQYRDGRFGANHLMILEL